jgi:hypothetical protein
MAAVKVWLPKGLCKDTVMGLEYLGTKDGVVELCLINYVFLFSDNGVIVTVLKQWVFVKLLHITNNVLLRDEMSDMLNMCGTCR